MSFQCLSISHHTAPLHLREQLSLTAEQQSNWLSKLGDTEAAILSTCNRLELITHVHSDEKMEGLWKSLLRQKQLRPQDVAAHTVNYKNYEAVRHLFQVSASLHSLVLGEAQILGQVTHAFEQAQRLGAAKHHLSLLFRSAIHAAKRVHTETHIGAGQISVSSLAIKHLESVLGHLSEQPILVIGAGEMGQAVLKGLEGRALSNVTLVSRTYETARQMAKLWGVNACPITQLYDLLTSVRIVFTASNAPFYILSQEDLAPIMQAREQRDLYIVDIAMPRNVDPQVGQLAGVNLFDLDDLQKSVEKNKHERRKAVSLAQRILDEELTRFWAEYEGRTVAPTISQLRQQVEHIRQQELSRILNRLPDGQQQELRLLFEEFSHRFMNKVLHEPTRNLKTKAGQGNGALFNAVARDLFGLKDET